jgi:ATP synthase protein I
MPDQRSGTRPGQLARQFAMATELPFLLVGGVVGGGFLGFLVDRWLKIKPWGMFVLGAIGFYVGVRQVLLRAGKSDPSDTGGNPQS